MKSIASVIIVMMSALLVSGVLAEIYSWTDENGVKHYSHTPPAERSVPVETAPEIQSDPNALQQQEKINETNVEAILKELEKENNEQAQAEAGSPSKAAATKKPPTRQERIAAEAEKLQEKIAWLEQLPPGAYTNSRSKQAIIGRYQYRLDQLQSNPDTYFKEYGY
jgi:hypothetical protein